MKHGPGKAAILAAGRGLRLRPVTDDRPKAMVSVAGKPVLHRIMEALRSGAGVSDFAVATGYRADVIKAAMPPAGCNASYIENVDWERSNSMLSLSLCMPALMDGGWIVEGDCCFDRQLIEKLPAGSQDSHWFVRPFLPEDDGCSLTTDAQGVITGLKIEAPNAKPQNVFKSCGVLRISAALARQLSGWLQAGIQAGRQGQYYDLILADHLAEARLIAVDIGHSPWVEIDNDADWRRAEAVFGDRP